MPTADMYADSGSTLSVEVLDTLTDDDGRTWAFVVETRHALMLFADLTQDSVGRRFNVRPDLLAEQ